MYSTTVLLNSFGQTIDASYFSPEDIIGGATFYVYKKTPSQKYYQYVCTLADGEYQFLDYNIINNQYYHYLVSNELKTSSGYEYIVYQNTKYNEKTQEKDLIFHKVRWDDFTICTIEETTEEGIYQKTGNIWTFKYNLQSEELTQNLNVKVMDTLGRYGKISSGNKNYDSSSITVLLGDMKEYKNYYNKTELDKNNNCVFTPVSFNEDFFDEEFSYDSKRLQYTEKDDINNPYGLEIEKLKRWKEFCADGELKLLRDRKGNAWIVQILEGPVNSINTYSNLQETTVTFSWQEVEDVSKVSIVLVGDT